MSRSVAWRHSCPNKVKVRLQIVSTARLYILHQTGPTGFHVKEEGKDKKLKVYLGDPHTCSCSTFMNERELCVHILWLLVKKFKFSTEDALVYQLGLIEREINELVLRELGERNISLKQETVTEDSSPSEQKEVNEGDVCPICQEVISQTTESLTYCRQSCGKSLHVRCMKMWADHQRSLGETKIKCPLCREDFGAYEDLQKESLETKKQTYKHSRAPNVHTGCVCCRCHTNPVTGVCYRCRECADYFLCSKCFLLESHNPTHTFQSRRYLSQKWKRTDPPKALPLLPPGITQGLQSRDISSQDYETLLQLDSNPDPSKGVAEHILFKFPSYPLKQTSNLLTQQECCEICSQTYTLGQWVRKLPNCSHQFHRDCIDYKLRYFQTTCPIDGRDVYPKRKLEIRLKSHSANQTPKIGSAKGLKHGCIVSGPLLSLGSLPSINTRAGDRVDMLVAGAQLIQNYPTRSEDISVTRPLLPISLDNNLQQMESSPITASQSLLLCKPLLSHGQSPLKLPSLSRTTSHPTKIARPVRSTAPGHNKRVRRHTDTRPDTTQFQDLYVGSQAAVPTVIHPSNAKPTPRPRQHLLSTNRVGPQFDQLEVTSAACRFRN